MTAQLQERDKREAAAAADLLEHPGWQVVIKDVTREAKAARGVLFANLKPEAEIQYAHARGTLAVLKNIVLAVYRRANKEVPPNVASLFE